MQENTIIAVASGIGGAISTLRLSGDKSIKIAEQFFSSKNSTPLSLRKPFSLHFGNIIDRKGEIIDEVLLSMFKAPASYTGEDMIEISCHASSYITGRIIEEALALGARTADPGEFTLRAYSNGKLDLVQAEGVADLISTTNATTHRLAMNQMRGGYSQEFTELRKKLVHFMSMIELELDFGEEDVEFADRTKLKELLFIIKNKIDSLTASFKNGNALKNGVPVAIVGKPNVGKSTLLNALLNEEKAIVSDIAGTTRDIIEDTKTIGGVTFRFIDTAGIRNSDDTLEAIGIERTFDRLHKAHVILLIVDNIENINTQITELQLTNDQELIIIINKCDLHEDLDTSSLSHSCFNISAKNHVGIDKLEAHLSEMYGNAQNEVIITNARHWELLSLSLEGINRAIEGLDNGIPTDFIAQDLRESLHHLGSLTGEITSDTILHSIFSSFCIGK
ncbi:MAG: tRNA uridine-5-carboxymethylaminomethyl(34) synthesis GTPase MnmE [Bacteroidetes bacterium]|nr:tRNA uridine-5-carboxymethylaminomethyl(34) synthesis GTPase MnmE [Bacteroidota bacterium]